MAEATRGKKLQEENEDAKQMTDRPEDENEAERRAVEKVEAEADLTPVEQTERDAKPPELRDVVPADEDPTKRELVEGQEELLEERGYAG